MMLITCLTTGPLHAAVLANDTDRLRALCQKNDVALVNAADGQGRTALHLAAHTGSPALVWPLISHGASVLARDGEGATPLHRAVGGNHGEVAAMLLDRGCPLDVADAAGDTVLHLAVRNGNNELLAVLLRKGANPDLANRKGESPLHESLSLWRPQSAQLLLRCGASVNAPSRAHSLATPLMMACGNEDDGDGVGLQLVETLLDYEADPHLKDQHGKTAADYAFSAGRRDVTAMLDEFIRAQADVEEENETLRDNEEDSFDDGGDGLDQYGAAAGQTPVPLLADDVREEFTPYTGPAEAVAPEELSSWGSSSASKGEAQVRRNIYYYTYSKVCFNRIILGFVRIKTFSGHFGLVEVSEFRRRRGETRQHGRGAEQGGRRQCGPEGQSENLGEEVRGRRRGKWSWRG